MKETAHVIKLERTPYNIYLAAQQALSVCGQIPRADIKAYAIETIEAIIQEDVSISNKPAGCAVLLLKRCIESVGEIHEVTEELRAFLNTLKKFVNPGTLKQIEKIEVI